MVAVKIKAVNVRAWPGLCRFATPTLSFPLLWGWCVPSLPVLGVGSERDEMELLTDRLQEMRGGAEHRTSPQSRGLGELPHLQTSMGTGSPFAAVKSDSTVPADPRGWQQADVFLPLFCLFPVP